MALLTAGTAIAGAYNVYWRHNSSSGAATWVGMLEDGCELEWQPEYEPITGDQYGGSIIDGVYRGGNTYLSMVLLEFNRAIVQQMAWPHVGSGGAVGALTPSTELSVGQLLSDNEGQLYLDAITGPPAESDAVIVDPIEFGRAHIAPNFPLRLLFASKLRRVPLRFLCMPYEYSGSTYVFRQNIAVPT